MHSCIKEFIPYLYTPPFSRSKGFQGESVKFLSSTSSQSSRRRDSGTDHHDRPWKFVQKNYRRREQFCLTFFQDLGQPAHRMKIEGEGRIEDVFWAKSCKTPRKDNEFNAAQHARGTEHLTGMVQDNHKLSKSWSSLLNTIGGQWVSSIHNGNSCWLKAKYINLWKRESNVETQSWWETDVKRSRHIG